MNGITLTSSAQPVAPAADHSARCSALGRNISSAKGSTHMSDGHDVVEKVVQKTISLNPSCSESAISSPLERAYFAERCWLSGLQPEGRRVTSMEVDDFYRQAEHPIERVGFRERCCLMGVPLSAQPITADQIMSDYQAAGAPASVLEYFQKKCYQLGILLPSCQVGSEAGYSGL